MYDLSVLQTICTQTAETMSNIKRFLDRKSIEYNDMSSHLMLGKNIIIPIETHIIMLSNNESIITLHNSSDVALTRILSSMINERRV